MPRFYFHLHNAIQVHDKDGTHLSSLEEAKEQAVKAARSVMAEDIKEAGEITLSHWIQIADEAGEKLLVVPFRACVTVHP